MFNFTTKTGIELRDLSRMRRVWLIIGIMCFFIAITLSLFIKNYYAIILIIPMISLVFSYNNVLHRKTIVETSISLNFKENVIDIEMPYAVVINKTGHPVRFTVIYENVTACKYFEKTKVLSFCFDAIKIIDKKVKSVKNEKLDITVPSKIENRIINECKKHIQTFKIIIDVNPTHKGGINDER